MASRKRPRSPDSEAPVAAFDTFTCWPLLLSEMKAEIRTRVARWTLPALALASKAEQAATGYANRSLAGLWRTALLAAWLCPTEEGETAQDQWMAPETTIQWTKLSPTTFYQLACTLVYTKQAARLAHLRARIPADQRFRAEDSAVLANLAVDKAWHYWANHAALFLPHSRSDYPLFVATLCRRGRAGNLLLDEYATILGFSWGICSYSLPQCQRVTTTLTGQTCRTCRKLTCNQHVMMPHTTCIACTYSGFLDRRRSSSEAGDESREDSSESDSSSL